MITIDLFDVLQAAWRAICADYDVTAELPDIGVIFDGVDPTEPAEAARGMLINLLSEMMECIGRFSPWYKRPARAFGVVLERNSATQPGHWTLSARALRAYAPVLDMLQRAIEHNKSVILATRFLDDLEQQRELADPCQAAHCQCDPPRTILIHRSVVGRVQIICDACRQPFK